MFKSFKFLSTSIFIFFTVFASADQYFETLHHNQLVPDHCQEFEVGFFPDNIKWLTYSIYGAKEAGFTNEYPIGRQEANDLWHIMKDHRFQSPWLSSPPIDGDRMAYFIEILSRAEQYMGYTWNAEGEILEALSLNDLSYQYDPQEYFFTGGIEYSKGRGPVIGELDLIVARRDNCQVVVIGESKLGLHRIGKAREQLSRFHNFISNIH